jgi:hypothetical protein
VTPQTIAIIQAEHLDTYRIKLHFDDGVEQVVDFQPFLVNCAHPALRAYLDPQRFHEFRIEFGDLVWGDYDLCFPVMDLYCNTIDRNRIEQKAA